MCVWTIIFLAGCASFDQVLATFTAARRDLGEILSAFEFLDDESMTCTTENLRHSNPLANSPFYLLVETSGSSSDHDEQKLNGFLENAMSSGLVHDGTIATEPSKISVSQT